VEIADNDGDQSWPCCGYYSADRGSRVRVDVEREWLRWCCCQEEEVFPRWTVEKSKKKKSSVGGVSVGREPVSATDDGAKAPMGSSPHGAALLAGPEQFSLDNARQACDVSCLMRCYSRYFLHLVESTMRLLGPSSNSKGL